MLARIRDSDYKGAEISFPAVMKNIGSCLDGSSEFLLNVDAFTLYIGNCTPDRLEKHFRDLALSEPFSDALGRQPVLKSWAQGAGGRETLNRAKEKLSGYIKDRNAIVHGNGNARAVVLADVEEVAAFFSALTSALCGMAKQSLA